MDTNGKGCKLSSNTTPEICKYFSLAVLFCENKLAEKNMARLKYIYFITVIAFTALIVSSVVLENSLFTYNALT